MNILITICARGGSKGIPGKNIKPLAGKSLIEYTIDVAKKFSSKYNATIALSTDDQAIKNAVKKTGITTEYLRPEHLATDTAGKADTIHDLILFQERINKTNYDFILDLDVTSPLRTMEDLERAFKLILNNPEALSLFSVNTANKNPYFNMVEENQNGFYTLVKKAESGIVMARQSAPKVYELNASLYWYRRAFFNQKNKSAITEKSLIYVMPHICFDLDHPIDFEFLDFLLSNNKLDFQVS